MSIEKDLMDRSNGVCELCGSGDGLTTYAVFPKDDEIVVCSKCSEQLKDTANLDETHWHCLNDSMWSETDAVKVVAYRLFHTMGNQDMIDMMYIEDSVKDWAEAGISDFGDAVYKDANGATINAGDTVVITKDLPVKGTGFTAKQGTAVRNVSLVQGDTTHVEGRVNGVKIHIKTCFVKKS